MKKFDYSFDDFFVELEYFGIEFVQRKDNQDMWGEALDHLSYEPIEYSNDWINYNLIYLSNEAECVDLGILIYSGGKLCGLWPLLGLKKQDKTFFSGPGSGMPILPPIFIKSTTKKLEKRICSRLFEVLNNYARNFSDDVFITQHTELGLNKASTLSDWYRQAMEYGASIEVKHDLYVDLSMSLQEIRRYYRKSYKPLINKGLKEWDHEIVTSGNLKRESWSAFQKFHEAVVGRKTRSLETWEEQYRIIASGNAFAVMLYHPISGSLVGGGLFHINRDMGHYGVGVYDRDLFDKPIGHVVQQLAIEHMKSLDVKWYRIGEKLYLHHDKNSTKKEVDISRFKEGFCSNMILRFVLTIPITK